MADAYPLCWPEGRPRTDERQDSRFDVTLGSARNNLMAELRLLGATNPILSTNIALRRDGRPVVNQPEPDDPGVAIYFEYNGKPTCFACDRWNLARDNVQAVRKTIEALRGITRWGTGDMLDAAFNGFQALPAPGQHARPPWRQVLGIAGLEHASPEELLARAEAAFKEKAKECHPDMGGTEDDMADLNTAIRQARDEIGVQVQSGAALTDRSAA